MHMHMHICMYTMFERGKLEVIDFYVSLSLIIIVRYCVLFSSYTKITSILVIINMCHVTTIHIIYILNVYIVK